MIGLIEQHREQIAALCRRYRLKRLELFGSAASGAFDPGHSDIDFFYEFDPSDTDGLADRFFGLKEDLERLLGVNVDMVSAPDATNPYFLQVANRHRLTLYAA
jgi:predicted nucleotidyltransferase